MLLVAAAGCNAPGDDEPQVWRFAIEESEGSVQHAYAMKFKEIIERKSHDRIQVAVYPIGTLGTSTQITEQLNMGVVEFAMASPGSLGKFIPELQVFLLHFVFSERDSVNRRVLADDDLRDTLDALYADKGLKFLSIFPEGEMVWTMKQQVRRPADFRGLKMRVMTSPILLSAYNVYGAAATPRPYAEVYSGLQLNMIDGQVNPVFAIERMKFYEVTDWMIFPKHAHFIATAAANRGFFENLPHDQQQMVVETIAELEDYVFDVQQQFQSKRLKTILAAKKVSRDELNIIGDLQPFVESLTDEERRELIDENRFLHLHPGLNAQEREAFRKRSEQVRDVYLKIGGPGAHALLDQIQRTVAEAEDEQAADAR